MLKGYDLHVDQSYEVSDLIVKLAEAYSALATGYKYYKKSGKSLEGASSQQHTRAPRWRHTT